MDKDIAAIKSKLQSLDQKSHCGELWDSPAAEKHGDGTVEPPLQSHTALTLLCNSAGQFPDDRSKPTTSPCDEPLLKEHADSAATVLRLSDGQADISSFTREAALSQDISINTVVMVMDEPPHREGSGCGSGEHVSVCEHSYSRSDMDQHQLWNKVFSLHEKILDLDRREESTVAKIQALETEICHLKRDGAVCKEKQKILKNMISSKMSF